MINYKLKTPVFTGKSESFRFPLVTPRNLNLD